MSRVILGAGTSAGSARRPRSSARGSRRTRPSGSWTPPGTSTSTFDTADAAGGRSEAWIGEWLAQGRGRPRRDRRRDEDLQPDGGGRRPRPSPHPDPPPGRGEPRASRPGAPAPLPRARVRPDVPQEETLQRSTSSSAPGRSAQSAPRTSPPSSLRRPRALRARGARPLRVGAELLLLLDDGDTEDVFAVCHEHGLGYEAFGPLAGGWLTGKYRRGRRIRRDRA